MSFSFASGGRNEGSDPQRPIRPTTNHARMKAGWRVATDTANVATTPATTPRLALRPKEAAAALGIGVRLLWSETNAGRIPHVKVGRAVLYPVDGLRDWLVRQSEGAKP